MHLSKPVLDVLQAGDLAVRTVHQKLAGGLVALNVASEVNRVPDNLIEKEALDRLCYELAKFVRSSANFPWFLHDLRIFAIWSCGCVFRD